MALIIFNCISFCIQVNRLTFIIFNKALRQIIRQSNKGAKGKMKKTPKKPPKNPKQTKTQSTKYCLLKDFKINSYFDKIFYKALRSNFNGVFPLFVIEFKWLS